MIRLLTQGWGYDKVTRQHTTYAVALDQRGVTWRPMLSSDVRNVEGIVREHIDGIAPDWALEPSSGGVLAVGPDEQIIATLVVGGMGLKGANIGIIQHLVVEPEWRSSGVGAVTLGLAHQVFPAQQKPVLYIGGCSPANARFYQRVGYTVLQPGEAMLLPGAPAAVAPRNVHYPCWMYREW